MIYFSYSLLIIYKFIFIQEYSHPMIKQMIIISLHTILVNVRDNYVPTLLYFIFLWLLVFKPRWVALPFRLCQFRRLLNRGHLKLLCPSSVTKGWKVKERININEDDYVDRYSTVQDLELGAVGWGHTLLPFLTLKTWMRDSQEKGTCTLAWQVPD